MLNLIDGLDGLAAGVASIAATAIFIVAVSKGQAEVAILAIILSGAALGFLPHNFNPAKIFMGDSGSMFLGFVLAGISAEGALKGAATFALVIPVVALGLPVSDTIFAIIRRYQNGDPIHKPDRGHIHHRLLAMGLSQKQAVLFMYVVSGGLGAAAVILTRMSALPAMFFIVVVCGALILLAERLEVIKPVRPRHRRLGM
jgi:UDP-GlcNAc:undecaprenyl-phosphate GlcNAc-1-phosphate transferase